MSNPNEDIRPGDIVSVNHGNYGRVEGLVIGSHHDHLGRQVVEVQLDHGEVYSTWYPTVTRVKRTIYTRPQPRTIQRSVYW